MFDVFGSVTKLFKLDKISIDNVIFRLHYKATVVILISFSLLVTAKQYIGDPIDCIVSGVPAKIMDTYCWIHSTFTLPSLLSGKVGEDVPHPGVGLQGEGEEAMYHKYYQWVCFFLFFQALLFYTPRFLWKSWEGKKLEKLIQQLNCPIVDKGVKKDRLALLVQYFTDNFHTMRWYAFKFFFCEVLNLINVIGQIFFMDHFLDGEFSTYGPDVWNFSELDPAERVDPMAKVFPKVTKCTFHKYGPSGTIMKLDGLCVLPLNIVNEKIMVFIWFWFVIVAVLSGLGLFYRLAVVFVDTVRLHLLRARARFSNVNTVTSVNELCDGVGPWFMLYQLGKNMDPQIFSKFLTNLEPALKRRGTV